MDDFKRTARTKYIDVGANLTDAMFRGIYNGQRKHPADVDEVLKRAFEDYNLDKIIISGESLDVSKEALQIANKYDGVYCTVGCRPTKCQDFEILGNPRAYLDGMIMLAEKNPQKIVAVGEFGLDYDRFNCCGRKMQIKYFNMQFDMARDTKLPIVIKYRKAGNDVCDALWKHKDKYTTGVVHSFEGTKEEAEDLLDMDMYIGVSGCSLKTEDNLEVLRGIPKEKIMIQTDSPWYEIQPGDAGGYSVTTKLPSKKKEEWNQGFSVKGRNEPSCIVQILEVLATVYEEKIEDLSEIIYTNTYNMFFKRLEKTED